MLLSIFLLPWLSLLLTMVARGRSLQLINLSSGILLLLAASGLLYQVINEGTQSIAFGAWALPYAIEMKADGLSAALVVCIAIVYLAVLLYQLHDDTADMPINWYPLQHGLIAACIAIAFAADLFNLYVWFELLLMALLGLFVLGGKVQHLDAAFKYFVLNMLGTLLMLSAVGLIYGATGHLNFTALQQVTHTTNINDTISLYVGLLMIALLLKAGAFPLFAWLPAAYHTLPAPLLALVGGLLTKITVYVLLRLSGQVFDTDFMLNALGGLAVITMLSGVLGAAYHWDVRRILAFHIVSQIGYLLLGIALGAATATGFFLFHNILVKANLLLIAGLMYAGAGHYDLRRIGGLYPAYTWLSILFLLNAFSLVGVPGTSGFWGKYLLVSESFQQEQFIWGGVALLTGLLTLYSMTKIWLEGFWKQHPDATVSLLPLAKTAYVAILLLSLAILVMGLYPEPFIAYLNVHTTNF